MNSRTLQSMRLRNLDLNVYKTGRGHLPTDFGVATVSKAPGGGYGAYIGELIDPNAIVFGETPAMACTNLLDRLARDADLSELAKIVEFPPMPEVVRPAMAA